MNKKKWIVGLSIASVMALLGTGFALNPGAVIAQSNQGTVSDYNGSR